MVSHEYEGLVNTSNLCTLSRKSGSYFLLVKSSWSALFDFLNGKTHAIRRRVNDKTQNLPLTFQYSGNKQSV